jgi:hypothetical protein
LTAPIRIRTVQRMSVRSSPCQLVVVSFSLSVLAACTAPRVGTTDPADAGGSTIGDASVTSDAGAVDAGAVDAGAVDAGAIDAGAIDAGAIDAGAIDAGAIDAGAIDAGAIDAGAIDAGPPLPTPQCASTSVGGVGSWQDGGWMTEPERTGGTATLLQNGDILVAGGDPAMYLPYRGAIPPDLYLTVERYSASTGQWRLAAPLSEGHQYHTATRLLDGRVLVAGSVGKVCGDYCGTPGETTAELYDPVADQWTLAAPMHVIFAHHAATLLADGRVLVAGGYGSGGCTANVEIYDPGTNTWADATPMNHARCDVGALLLASGEVLVAGTAWNNATNQVEMMTESYDPGTGLWHDGAPKPEPWGALFLLPLPSGRVMVAYRYVFDAPGYPHPIVDIFDPVAGTWTSTLRLSRVRVAPVGAALLDGRILMAGGELNEWSSGGSSALADLFDEKTGEWVEAADMTLPRQDPLVAPLGDGGALAIGGYEGCYQGYHYISSGYIQPVDKFVPGPPPASGP